MDSEKLTPPKKQPLSFTLSPKIVNRILWATLGLLIGFIGFLSKELWSSYKDSVENKLLPMQEQMAEISAQNQAIIANQYALREYLIKVGTKLGIPGDLPSMVAFSQQIQINTRSLPPIPQNTIPPMEAILPEGTRPKEEPILLN